MDHQDALREMFVEKYLLGELIGPSRETFEEHLFECPLCAADLKSGITFFEGARVELAQPLKHPSLVPAAVGVKQNTPGRLLQMLSPSWLVPALAACLLVIGYQSAVVIPSMHRQLAQADAPAIVDSLVLAGGASRGVTLPRVSAAEHGSFLLSIDIPAQDIYASYVCSLYSPSGTLAWRGTVSPQQAKDTVQIHVPAATTGRGENTLLVQGVRSDDPSGAKLDDLSRRTFLFVVKQ